MRRFRAFILFFAALLAPTFARGYTGVVVFGDNLSADPATSVSNIANHITTLANAGAHDFVVPNLPLLGEVPDYRGSSNESTLNTLSSQFDSQLATSLKNLKQSLNVNIFPVDVLTTFNNILANPSSYGFINVTQPAYNGSTTVSNP